jgi:sugar phosphate isomerase/epimerase
VPRFAICNETWGETPFAETCRRIAAAGYAGVEIAPFTLSREFGKLATGLTATERTQIKTTARDAGLTVAGLHWLLVPPPESLHLTTDDVETRLQTGAYLQDLAALCADLGGTVLVLGSPKQRNVPAGTDLAAARGRFLETITPCLSAAKGLGVTLCLEPLGPDETDFLNTLAEARELIAQSGRSACRTIFDVKAAATEGTPLPALIAQYADVIAHVHANDANRRGPGFGETDFAPIFAALSQAGYDGWVSVEVFDYAPDPDTIAHRSLQTMRAAQGAFL